MSASTFDSATRDNPKGVIIDCSHTRYHVVRAAALMVGWVVNDTDTEAKVPATFYDIPLASRADDATAHPPQVIWTDRSILSARVAKLQCYQRLNHFASMHVIARKAVLFRRLMQLFRLYLSTGFSGGDGSSAISVSPRFPLSRYFVYAIPQSFSSVADLGRLEAYQQQLIAGSAENNASLPFFIIKPNTGCEGRGIRLTTSPLDELTEAERIDKKRECIIQLYVDRPLLIDGKKFDLRLYVLLVSVTPAQRQQRLPGRITDTTKAPDNLEAVSPGIDDAAFSKNNDALTDVPPGVDGVCLYVHREGLVRICAEPYAPPTQENCADAQRHLTNYAVNRKSHLFRPAHVHAENVRKRVEGEIKVDDFDGAVEDSNKRSLTALAAYIEGLHIPGGWTRVQRRIDECIALTVLSGVEALRRELISAGGARGDRADGRGCFELLGFDVLLREESLEPVLMEVNHSPSLFCDTAFDFAVKSAVLRDTFRVLQTHLPPWKAFQGSGKKYATLTCPDSRGAREMAQSEEKLLSPTVEPPCGFRPLLPHYRGRRGYNSNGSNADGADEDTCDWQEGEREAQALMVQLSKRLR